MKAKAITLWVEQGTAEYRLPPMGAQQSGAKTITFPDVSLNKQNQPYSFQNGIDCFLQEMGYIE